MTDGQPNIVVFMADQMTPLALPFYGHKTCRAPHLQAVAEAGVVFDAAYCAVPLCGPARAGLMTGRLPSRIGAYDNATEFPTDIPSFAHGLRAAGYRTVLSGKMHFCGADQLHGFEQRLTTDIYPSDFNWTPDWTRPGERMEWYHNMASVLDAGPCVRTNQLDFDEEVVFAAESKLYDIVRDSDDRPFFMVVSLSHPHDPFAIPRDYWARYRDDEIDLPRHPVASNAPDPHSQRVREMCEIDATPPDARQVRNARRAYYGAISYVDDQFARLLRALEATGLADNTIIVIVSDHGEMLGERGLWYKMTFFEPSIRIPLVFYDPARFAPRRVREAVSSIDLLPTFLALAGAPPLPTAIEGRNLLPHLTGEGGHDEAFAEYLAEGAVSPIVMIRRGRYKFVHCPADPTQLYDVAADPDELRNLAAHPQLTDVVAAFEQQVAETWDIPRLHREVLESQRRRRFVAAALALGEQMPWDFQPHRDASQQYVRSHMALDALEAMARFPRPSRP
jgi:choline-sulfatase